jgi:hypothetical protein
MKNANRGDMVEIAPSFGEDDGYGFCLGEVVERSGADVLLWVKGKGEVWFPMSRIRHGR